MSNITLEQAQKDLQEIFKKHFPNGWLTVKNQCLGGGFNYYFGLLGDGNLNPDKQKCSNKILMNDIGYNLGYIHYDHNSFELTGEYFKFTINPTNKYHALDYAKLTVRKSTIKNHDWSKLLKTMDTRFKKYKQLVLDNRDNVYTNFNSYDSKFFDL